MVRQRRKSVELELEWLALGEPRKRVTPSWAYRIHRVAITAALVWFVGFAVLTLVLSVTSGR
jgi:hypothetical protein